MKRWLMYALMLLLVGGSWFLYARTGNEIKVKDERILQLQNSGENEEAATLTTEKESIEGTRIFNGVLLAFLSAGFIGIFFVVEVLPTLAHRFTHAIYDSAEMTERDVMHGARSLLAQGDYAGAIEAFRQAAAADPLNRLPWVEIAKIHKDHLNNSAAAVQTIRQALESQEWEINDAAYFLFRLAELYNEVEDDRASAVAIMQQVIDEFPGTRHSANASHKLHEWEHEAAATMVGSGTVA